MEIPDNLNFLIVEDLVSDSFLLQRQLKKISEHPEIRFVDTEIALINALKTFIPDIVLSDFNLVGMNAFDVIRIVKEYNDKIPFVVISGNLKDEGDVEKLIAAGASGFFHKDPINTLGDRLKPLIKKILLEKKEQLDKLGSERKKYERRKSQSDFLREYTFNDTDSSDTKPESTKTFLASLRNLFSRS